MQGNLNILHLEDDRLDADLVRETLASQGIVSHIVAIETEAELRASLRNGPIDLVISDYSLPGFNGMTALRIVRELRPELPFIFVSGTIGEEIAIESLKNGATDYVLKQGLQRLGLSVQRARREIKEREESRRTDEALRESEFRYKMLFEDNPLPMWVFSLETLAFLAVNEAAIQLYGYSRDEFLAMTIRDIRPQEDLAALLEGLQRDTKGLDRSGTRQHQKKDGASIYVEITAHRIDFSGQPAEIVLANDITERKLTEEALRVSEARYHTLFDHAPDGIVIADPESYYLDANASICRMLGYTRDELIGLHASDIVTQTEVQHIASALSAIKARSNYHREWQFRRHDGSVFPAEVISTMMPDGNLLGMISDITERKQADGALIESEARFRFLNDLVEATRSLVDPEQIMTVMTRMLGEHLRASRCAYADVENDGEQFTILHDYTDNCESTAGNYRLSLFGAQAVSTLHRGQTLIIRDVDAELSPADGADMFNAIGIKAIITCPLVKEGVLRAMMAVHQATPRAWKSSEIAIVQDVVERCWATIERRTAEEKLQQLNAKLEQRVNERTVQLEEANQQLEAANKELEAFSYSVSHDLRAPLRHINGFSLALLEDYEDKLDETGKDYLHQVRSASQEMAQLIDDVLQLARVTRAEMRREPVDLSEIARHVISDLRSGDQERSVVVEIEAGLVTQSDKRLMKIMLTNLLGNAWKFTARQERAAIAFGQEKRNGQSVYFVCDNGAGFDMAYVNKLFRAFQRLHAAGEFEGTGIGLATVQRIVTRHGGHVWADGKLNTGATFYFTLQGSGELVNGEQSDPAG